MNEVSIIDLDKYAIIYGIVFVDHTITNILATEKLFLFADSNFHIWSIKTEDFAPLGLYATQQHREEFTPQDPKKTNYIAHKNRILKLHHYKDYIFSINIWMSR